MRASDIVRQFCGALGEGVHAARRRLMLSLVDAVLQSQRVALTALGHALTSKTAAKHRIKRVDRFVGNSRVHEEIACWYGAVARRLLRHNRRPVILLDWTKTVGPFYALVAAVAFSGRAIPIFAEVHPESSLSARSVQDEFVTKLAGLLPKNTRPIIVADAGFKTPFFRSVRRHGWDFVIRLRGDGVLRKWRSSARERDPRLRFRALFASATDRARDLGEWSPYSASGNLPPPCRVVLSARPASAEGPPRKDPYGRRATEPWLLATSIRHESTVNVINLYRLRMQIELTFRDAKNGNLGLAFEHARSRSAQRQAVLLLLACLALAAVLLVGASAESEGRARHYCANTVRSRRVYSLTRLGRFVLDSWPTAPALVVVTARSMVYRFQRTHVQLRLPWTTLHYGKWR